MAVLDYLISGATVFDGAAIEPKHLDVGIAKDQIAYLGEPLGAAASRRRIDAAGLYLCPGFIDTHASTGLGYRFPHAGDHKLFQGVTTEIIGNCGTSPGPVAESLVPVMEQLAGQIGFDFDWRSLREWFAGIEGYGLSLNVGTYVGHSTVRQGVCSGLQASRQERERMETLVDEAMRDGALGLSTGLVYAPGSFAETAEIVELARVASTGGGIYASHIRDEREDLEKSIEEAIDVCRLGRVPVLISHLKAGERPNWGKIPRIIERIERARTDGLAVNFEVYPYTATSTKLRTFIPKDALAEGPEGMVRRLRDGRWRRRSVEWLRQRGTDFDAMVLITDSMEGAAGKSIGRLARTRRQDPAHLAIDLLIHDPDTWIVYHCISEEDMEAAILWKNSIICSDSWSYPVNAPTQIGDPHPRTFGAFTRFLERYALRRQRLSFGQAVRKITSYPAQWLRLLRRGRLARGYYADLILLDPTRVSEKATYAEPRRMSEGTEYVWVNGVLMLEKGQLHGHKPGRVLRNRKCGVN